LFKKLNISSYKLIFFAEADKPEHLST